MNKDLKIFKSLCFFTMCVSTIAVAQDDSDEVHHKGIVSSFSLGARFLSAKHARGVYFYRDFQIDPVIAPFFWDDRIEFLGNSLGFRDYLIDKKLRLRTKVTMIDDDPLFPNRKQFKVGTPSRPMTFEWTTGLELFLPKYDDSYMMELDLYYSKDVSISHGNYVELIAKFKLGTMQSIFSGPVVEPNLVLSVGAGDKAHNEYYYGQGAGEFNVNNFYYGMWFAFPKSADRYFPVLQIMGFTTLGYDNRHASYAQGNSEGVVVSFIATTDILN